ncbi:MAG: peptidoglycan editing factor PgeF [Thermanaeromonas sp.]|uniref:peptidoglycan editing factor PgeF n=1 Tax=Thermanaeromonas sp. TaxID=2003697 RepID=UPI00243B4F6B|nr:peptidoglycan editing factor PgeF [Thermanaeromonas sp.]MCG0276973.1 peptidoglycan editing factor PgeF [Thermanaeromonas sp.]
MPFFRVSFLEKLAPVTAIFSTRQGGQSEGPYKSLNLGFHVGDDYAKVLANRRLLAEVSGLPLEKWVAGEQVHGAKVAVVDSGQAGSGAEDPGTSLKGVDGLITADKGVVLAAFFADCVPVYLLDVKRQVIGLVHAGWRGTVKRIAARAVELMNEVFGSRGRDCWAVVGPSIGPCCYEVGPEVEESFKSFSWAGKVLKPGEGGRLHLDLWEATRLTLLDMGLLPERIAVASLCTACHSDIFFSHRGSGGHTGRLGALLGWRLDGE